MTMQVLGLGTAAPAGVVSQAEAAEAARARCCADERQGRLLEALYRQTNVKWRGSVLARSAIPQANQGGEGENDASTQAYPGAVADFEGFYGIPGTGNGHGPTVSGRMAAYVERAPGLAAEAARAALGRAGVGAEEVDQVVVVSCTGLVSPGLDIRLIELLGLRPDVGRTVIGFMGCHGAINGLRVADALAESRPGATVLLVCVELCSLHFQYGWDPQQIVANALFADGAAAIVGRSPKSQDAGPGTWDVGLGTLAGTASILIPDSREDMTWVIGDHGFRMTLSARVPRLIEQHLRGWLEPWLAGRGLRVEDVGSWAIHPGGPRIVEAAEAGLGLPAGVAEASRAVLAEHGNMSSPTVLFILERLMAERASRNPRSPLPCVLLAFGPGLVAEAALLR